MTNERNKITIGWREWVSLPELGIQNIKAKVDSGAKTSALHAYLLEPFVEGGKKKIKFSIHPIQKKTDISKTCVATVIDQRIVMDSGGHREERFVINTSILLGTKKWTIEITLTNRDTMAYRMLLGRQALAGQCVIDPEISYLFSKNKKFSSPKKKLFRGTLNNIHE